jgi:hypothetical protein
MQHIACQLRMKKKRDAVVNMSEEENNIDYYLTRREFIARLKTHHRSPLGPFFNDNNFYITCTGITDAISDHALTSGVYDLLKHDLEFILNLTSRIK